MPRHLTRRQLLVLPVAATLSATLAPHAQATDGQAWSLPIREPGGVPGDGFTIRCAYASENLAHHPGWYHTAEDWHRDGTVDSAGAEVVAVAAGVVVYADFDYPGRVVVVQHAVDQLSVYGHLDYALDVSVGQAVVAGQTIGRVLAASGWRAENHLHFETRSFLIAETINGGAPQHGVNCGVQCAPGPGYWPQSAEHPSALGWWNPTHLIHRQLAAAGRLQEALVTTGADGTVAVARVAPDSASIAVREIALRAGDRYPLLAMESGAPDSLETSALGYRVWYLLEIAPGVNGWVEAWVADTAWAGQDGRPSCVRPMLVPVPVS